MSVTTEPLLLFRSRGEAAAGREKPPRVKILWQEVFYHISVARSTKNCRDALNLQCSELRNPQRIAKGAAPREVGSTEDRPLSFLYDPPPKRPIVQGFWHASLNSNNPNRPSGFLAVFPLAAASFSVSLLNKQQLSSLWW